MSSLPFELERLIFEIAALQDTNHKHRIQIILVAKRVYEWIRPILYRVVVIGGRRLEISGALTISNLSNSQVTNSARFVRNLFSCFPSHSHIEIISTFPNIENFASWGYTISCEFLEKLNKLPLRRLSLYLGSRSLREAIELCPAFKNLTHIEIFSPIVQDDLKALIHLPKLTHLSFTFSYVDDAAVRDLLKHCISLQVVIRHYDYRDVISTTKLDDLRYLVLGDELVMQDLIEEWARSANGLTGCWEIAEAIIEARKANLFKDTAPSVLSRRTWMEHLNDDGMR